MIEQIAEVISERHKTHGEYGDVAITAQAIKAALREDRTNWHRLHERNKESLDLIATKMARIVCGDEYHPDHWNDIEGYARIAAKQ